MMCRLRHLHRLREAQDGVAGGMPFRQNVEASRYRIPRGYARPSVSRRIVMLNLLPQLKMPQAKTSYTSASSENSALSSLQKSSVTEWGSPAMRSASSTCPSPYLKALRRQGVACAPPSVRRDIQVAAVRAL
jgi:hypothetical protein